MARHCRVLRGHLPGRARRGRGGICDDDDRPNLREELGRLHDAGCDIAAIANVIPHNRLAAILEEGPVQSVDIVGSKLAGCGATDVVVLGTEVTIRETLFDDALRQVGMNVRRAKRAEIAAHNDLLETYFHAGRAEEGREPLIRYIRSAFGSKEPLCILACTDLAPAFPDKTGQVVFEPDGIQFFDAAAAHVDAVPAATRGNFHQSQVAGR